MASGSHGGHYPAAYASGYGIRAVVFNDAGIGLQNAGVAGIMALDRVGMAAAAVDAMTAHIGSAHSLVATGIISTANKTARACGVAPGQTVREALQLLANAPTPDATLPATDEARRVTRLTSGRDVQVLDSASLVGPQDQGALVVTGSHGALIGGDPKRALKARAQAAVFNDAGGGLDGIGFTRLPALDQMGVAAVTVSADTARIGDAASALQEGVISQANEHALKTGAGPGVSVLDWLTTF